MSTNSVSWRLPAWRSFMWVGVVASVVAWTWAWAVGQGAQAFMLLVALAAVVFAYRATNGMRLAVVGLMVAGFVMFLAALYYMFWVMMPNTASSAVDLVAMAVFPLVSAAVLLLGAAAGYRHVREGEGETARTPGQS